MTGNKQHNGMYSFRMIGGLLSLALGGLVSCSSGDSPSATATTSYQRGVVRPVGVRQQHRGQDAIESWR